ncbi:hypothetical protein ACLOJK_000242 [Asimina triloba]
MVKDPMITLPSACFTPLDPSQKVRISWLFPEMEKGIRRWVVDISHWNPPQNEFLSALSLLPLHEHASITRFFKFEDKKRALVSRLLQYVLVHQVLQIPFEEIVIKRTIEGKPYLVQRVQMFPNFKSGEVQIQYSFFKSGKIQKNNNNAYLSAAQTGEVHKKNVNENVTEGSEFPNLNFNASHHGDYVGIASEPLCLVGLDIVSHTIPKQETAQEFIGHFSTYLTRLEWNKIVNAGSADEILAEFYRCSNISLLEEWLLGCFNGIKEMTICIGKMKDRIYWCLKEAYVKAIGAGLGYRLDRLEFHHTKWNDISVHVDGELSREWRFWLFNLGKQHLACVVRGPPSGAVESYRRSLKQVDFKEEEYYSALEFPNTGFVFLTVQQLISMSNKKVGTEDCDFLAVEMEPTSRDTGQGVFKIIH